MTALSGAPLAAARVALVWRRSWKRTPSMPVARHAGSHTRLRKFSRRSGVPSGITNTRPSTPGSLHLARCSTITSQMNCGSTTVRVPAVVFGGPPHEVAVDLGALLDDAHALVQRIEVATPEVGELTPAQAGVRGEQDECLPSRLDRFRARRPLRRLRSASPATARCPRP